MSRTYIPFYFVFLVFSLNFCRMMIILLIFQRCIIYVKTIFHVGRANTVLFSRELANRHIQRSYRLRYFLCRNTLFSNKITRLKQVSFSYFKYEERNFEVNLRNHLNAKSHVKVALANDGSEKTNEEGRDQYYGSYFGSEIKRTRQYERPTTVQPSDLCPRQMKCIR